MSRLSVYLLGPFRVTLDGAPITGFESNKVRALLAYLAVEADHPHSRETLAGFLWPNQPERTARHNLSQALSNLRRVIHDRDAEPPFLHVTRWTVQFNRESDHQLDVAEFAAQVAAVESHPHLRLERCESCLRRLERLAALYRGEFLTGFFVDDSVPFSEWATLLRERFHRQVLDTLYHLTEYYEARRDYKRARRYARRQVELEPWREEAHQQLMRLLAHSGQRSAALQQYETCRRILADELNIAPHQKTTALYERIRAAGRATPHNLPPQLTTFVGRERELSAIAERLADPGCRLLTLTGLGGIGKTRLALQAAQEHLANFLHGVYFIPLAGLGAADFFATTVADALDFSFSGRQEPETQLLDYLREKELLLVLDNLEHLLPPHQSEIRRLVLEILRQAPAVKMLVTSRERLNLQVEWIFHVRGLACPDECESTDADVREYSAVRLFLERARRVEPDFSLSPTVTSAMVRICHLLEGMPLGIELAAASISTLSCEQVAAEIERNLDTLVTTMQDVPERHRSVRAVFEYSWNSLSEEERRVFRKLTPLRGSFDVRAAQEVAGASVWILSSLTDRSLVRKVSATRYEIHELLRQYAAEKLDQHPQERKETHERHCEYYAEFLHQRAEHLQGDRQRESLAEIHAEIENVRAAWQYAVAHTKEDALEKSIFGLLRFYERRSWFQEGLNVFGKAAASLEASFGPLDQVMGRRAIIMSMLLSQQGWYAHRLGRSEEAMSLLQKSLVILRRQGVRWELAKVLNESGVVAYRAGDYVGARRLYEESLAVCRQLGNRRELAVALSNLGNVCRAMGEYEQAKKFLRESVDVFRERGDQYSMAVSLNNLGEVFRALGDRLQARACYRQGLAIRREIGDRMGIAVSLTNLAGVAQVLGEYEDSLQLARESLEIFVELDNQRESAYPIHIMGLVARDLEDYDEALACYRQAIEISMKTRNRAKVLDILKDVAFLLVKRGELKQAATLAAMVLHHSATQRETGRNAEAILSELEARLPPAVVAECRERGEAHTLETVLVDVLDAALPHG